VRCGEVLKALAVSCGVLASFLKKGVIKAERKRAGARKRP